MIVAQKIRRNQLAMREMSLCTTLKWQFDDLLIRTGITCFFEIDKDNAHIGLNARQRLELFFLLQECVLTAVSYSDSQQFQVAVRCDEQQLLMTFCSLRASSSSHNHATCLAQCGITSRLDALGCKLVVARNGVNQNAILTFSSIR